ncbi:MAG: NAD(P)-dependent alcohol dehydrogenase [Candidatus Omnitrophota bacterium]
MQALVLERKGVLAIREINIQEELGPNDVRIALHTVGICGSDVHYYIHGRIGPFVVEKPMVLGHEASGVVMETGDNVNHLVPGDRVCMEPGIPEPTSKASMLGIYNLDPNIRFWATPPIHGITRPEVVHPANFTFKLPTGVTFAEGAMVEPLAVGIHATNKARIRPGDIAAVFGSGTIGLLTALSALAAGCSEVFIIDIIQSKLEIAKKLGISNIINSNIQDPIGMINQATSGWGVDVVFEASGSAKVISTAIQIIKPSGCLVYIGMPTDLVPMNIVEIEAKEIRIETVFRYAHVYDRALALMKTGKINVKPLITDIFPFKDSISAYQYAVEPKVTSVKVQIEIME